MDQLTPAARRTGERYAHVLDLVNRVSTAVNGGSWAYLSDLAGELSTAADELSAAASALTREERASSPADVLTAVVDHATSVRHEDLIGLLHNRPSAPVDGSRSGVDATD